MIRSWHLVLLVIIVTKEKWCSRDKHVRTLRMIESVLDCDSREAGESDEAEGECESSLWWWRHQLRPVIRSLLILQGVTMRPETRRRLEGVCPSLGIALPASERGGHSQGGSEWNWLPVLPNIIWLQFILFYLTEAIISECLCSIFTPSGSRHHGDTLEELSPRLRRQTSASVRQTRPTRGIPQRGGGRDTSRASTSPPSQCSGASTAGSRAPPWPARTALRRRGSPGTGWSCPSTWRGPHPAPGHPTESLRRPQIKWGISSEPTLWNSKTLGSETREAEPQSVQRLEAGQPLPGGQRPSRRRQQRT